MKASTTRCDRSRRAASTLPYPRPVTVTTTSRATPRRAVTIAAAVDVMAVLAFAAAGRRSHGEALTLTGLASTAWPFLVGLAAGWLVLRVRRAPLAPVRSGLPLALLTVAGGMVLRLLTGQGTALPFVLVATTATLLLLVGWRALATLWRVRA